MLIDWLKLQWLVDSLFGEAWLSLGLSDVSDASLCLAGGVEPDADTGSD